MTHTIITSVPLLMDVGVSPPTADGLNMHTGRGTYGPVVVSEPLPGGVIQTSGRGEQILPPGVLTGRSGALRVTYKAGATGSTRAIAFLADGNSRLVGIAVDSNNRPYAVIRDIAGNVVAGSAPLGLVVPEGEVWTFTVTWDSQNLVVGSGGFYAAVKYNQEILPGSGWTTPATSTWTAFVPTSLLLGYAGFAPDANGTILKVQASDVPGI